MARASPVPSIPPRDYQDGFPLPTSPTPPRRILEEEEAFLLRSPPVPPRDEFEGASKFASQPALTFPSRDEKQDFGSHSTSSHQIFGPDIVSSSPSFIPSSIQPSSPSPPPSRNNSRPNTPTTPPHGNNESSFNRSLSGKEQNLSSSNTMAPRPPSDNSLALSSPTHPLSMSDLTISQKLDKTLPSFSCLPSHEEARDPSIPNSPDDGEESPLLPPLSSPPPLSALSKVEQTSGVVTDNDSLTTWGLDLLAFYKLCKEGRKLQDQVKISRKFDHYPTFRDEASEDVKTKQKVLLHSFDELLSRNPFSLAVSENLLSGLQEVANEIQEDPSPIVFFQLQEQLAHLHGVLGGPYLRAIYHWYPEQPKSSECLSLLVDFGDRALTECNEMFALPPPSFTGGSIAPPSGIKQLTAPPPSNSINDRFRRATFIFSLSLPAVLALSTPRQAENEHFYLWEQSFRFPFSCLRPFATRPSYSSPLPRSSASKDLFEKFLKYLGHLQNSQDVPNTPPRLSPIDVRDSYCSLRSFATKLLCGFEAKEWMTETLTSLSREHPVSSPPPSISPNRFLHSVLLVCSSFLQAFDPQYGTLSGLGCDSFFENLWATVSDLNISKEKIPRSLRELFYCALQIQTTTGLFAYYHHLIQRVALGCQWLVLGPLEPQDVRTFHFTLHTLCLLLQGCLVELAYML